MAPIVSAHAKATINLKDVSAGLFGLVLLLATSYCINQLFSLEMPENKEFPFLSPWVKILIALLSLIPGLAIGWFATSRPWRIAMVVGFCGGILEDASLYSSLLTKYADKLNILGNPGIDDYLTAGITKAIYLCAFTAVGVLLRLRAER